MLPRKQDGKQRPCTCTHVAARGSPTRHRGNCSWNGAKRGVQPGDSFQRCVDEHVKKGGQQYKKACQKIRDTDEHKYSDKHQTYSEHQRPKRLDQSGGQGAPARADHFRVKVTFQIVVQHRRAPGSAPHAQQRENQKRQRIAAAGTKKESKCGGHQDHEEDPRLGEFQVKAKRVVTFHGAAPFPAEQPSFSHSSKVPTATSGRKTSI